MTIHYHGTPITPRSVIQELSGRHFCVSHAQPQDVEWVHAHGQSVMLDNGAFTAWRTGKVPSWSAYYDWCAQWLQHPTTWAVIPDVIDGDEAANDALLLKWPFRQRGAPVWHMHESIPRLLDLADGWARVCIGSSREFATVGDARWHARMTEAMNALCVGGVVPVWVHMLRGMAATRWGYPFASVDSTDIARNHNRQQNDARRMADVWDSVQCRPTWEPVPVQGVLLG